ncbi:hypothetical protein ACFLV4_07275 [Chloroflexota bacterium]
MGENEEIPVISSHRLGREDRSTHIWVDKGDKIIVKAYKNSLKAS